MPKQIRIKGKLYREFLALGSRKEALKKAKEMRNLGYRATIRPYGKLGNWILYIRKK